jgi:anti-sigma regulatory factor (Ser/Thr protein kinase)
MLEGWAQIMNTEPALTTRLELVPNLVAAKVARQFVARACLDWHLGSRRPAAVAIVSELTANAVQHTGSTDLEVILALSSNRLRVAVRGRHPSPTPDPTRRPADHGRPGRRLVHSLADLTGTLPTREGGTLVWAILGPR